MAKFLAIDWDQGELRVVLAQVKHGTIHIRRAIAWSEERNPNPAEAEALGQRLKERLKSAGIPTAPVLACIGRDRVILKEIRHPPVEAREEPGLVRFQAIKELNDAPGEVIIDYVPAGQAAGERRALALILRRELSQTWQSLCKAAGLKLAGLSPRPFGSVACLPAASEALAVLSVEERRAEFCIAQEGQLLLARSLPAPLTEADLLAEIRRNLAVHAGQHPQQLVRGLFVTDNRLAAQLQDKLAIPVRTLDPFSGLRIDAALPDRRGSFAGVVGLLRAWAPARALPINFLQPREPKPSQDVNSWKLAAAVAAALLLVIGGSVAAYLHLAERDSELKRLTRERLLLDAQMASIDSDAAGIKALSDWSDSSVVWLDELYDLTHRISDHSAMRVTQLSAELSGTRDKSSKDKKADRYVGKMVIRGVSSDRSAAVDNLIAQMVHDGGYKVGASQWSQNQMGLERFRFNQQFATPVELEFRRPDRFVRSLPPRPAERRPAPAAADAPAIPFDLGGLQP